MEEYRRVPLQYRKPAHLPSAGTVEYPCEHSEYPMGVPRVPLQYRKPAHLPSGPGGTRRRWSVRTLNPTP